MRGSSPIRRTILPSGGVIKGMNSKIIGDISEASVIAALLKSGLNVLMPFGDRNRYDIVIEHDGKFERVQIKTGRQRGRVIVYNTQSSTRVNGKRCELGYQGQVETFAVYHRELDRVYMVPVGKAATGKGSLRLGPKGGSGVGPRCLYADDYILRSVSSVQ